MVYYISRDYLSQNTTTANRKYIASYLMSIFMRRILGYSYVGDTNYPINNIGNLLIATGDSTPTVAPTFGVGSRAGIANNGSAIEVQIPLNVKVVETTDIGRILVLKSTLYPTRNNGLFLITAIQRGNSTTIAAGSNGASLPQGTINVASTTGFPVSGTFFVGAITTITASSNGAALPQATINVASTTGFPASGTILVNTSAGQQTVNYTGTTATTFTGCTGGTGTMVTGGTIITGTGFQTITYTGTNATQFTGCTGGTGTLVTGQVVYNQNKYVIDYRGNGDLSIPEANDTMQWYLYDKDINCPVNGAGNGSGGYNGIGSVTPRIILQSPHPLGWQVRICNESTGDSPVNIFNGACSPITAAPGFGGNSAGDYPIGSDVLHSNIFYNLSGAVANADYVIGNGFGDDASAGAQHRYTFIGDDTGFSVQMVARRLLNATGPRSIYVVFGLPENEPAPLPIKSVRRLYILASARGDVGNGQVNDVSLAASYTNSVGIHGAAFHDSPISAFPSALAYVTNNNQLAGPAFDAQAGDSPFTSATELMPVDINTGMVYSYGGSTPSFALPLIPKCLGTIPFMRFGRGNFGNYTLTTDNTSWTVTSATNASPISITTSVNHSLITGQSVAIHSVTGNTAANGTWTVTVTGSNTFTLDGSTGNGTGSTGTVLRGAQWQHMRNGIYFPWNGPAVAP